MPLETDQGKQNPASNWRCIFPAKALDQDAYSVLADKKLLKVVQTRVEHLADDRAPSRSTSRPLMPGKIKFADFQGPKKLQAFLSLFPPCTITAAARRPADQAQPTRILFDSSAAATDTGFRPRLSGRACRATGRCELLRRGSFSFGKYVQ